MAHTNVSPTASISSYKSYASYNQQVNKPPDLFNEKKKCSIVHGIEKLLAKTIRKMNDSEYHGFIRYLDKFFLKQLILKHHPYPSLTTRQIIWIKNHFDYSAGSYNDIIPLIEEGSKRTLRKLRYAHFLKPYFSKHDESVVNEIIAPRWWTKYDFDIYKAIQTVSLIREYAGYMTKAQKIAFRKHLQAFIEENRDDLKKATKFYRKHHRRRTPLTDKELMGFNPEVYRKMKNFADVIQNASYLYL